MDLKRCETCAYSIASGPKDKDELGATDYVCKNDEVSMQVVDWCGGCMEYEMMDIKKILGQPKCEERIMDDDLEMLREQRRKMIARGKW